MKPRSLTLIFGCVLTAGIFAQDCHLYYPAKENTQLEYTQYDKKGKVSGTTRQKITAVKKTAGSLEADISSEHFDAKGKSLGTIQMKARCEAGIFYIDMKNYFNPDSKGSEQDLEMTVEGGNMELPWDLKPGETLKDGDMKISFGSGGMGMMNTTISITNRKVDGVEDVTTPAGTFSCYKISYDISTKMMITVNMKGVEWYAKDVGLVKSESYSRDGKLMGSSMLTLLKE
jgi:hypothetical protein